jgi:hypothetical protein
MTEYKRGDRVKIVNAKRQPWVTEIVGKFATVEQDKGGYVTIRERDLDPSSSGIWKSNLELVDKSLEDQLADAEKAVAELKQKIADAKPKVSDLPLGTVIDSGRDYYTKVAKDSWVVVDKSRNHTFKRSDSIAVYSIAVYRDNYLNEQGFEVIREGI